MNDKELLARLKAADPAPQSQAPPNDPVRLLEAVMSTSELTRTAPTTSRPRRGPALVGGVAAALILGATITWGASGFSSTSPTAAAPLTLTVGEGDNGDRCAGPTVASLRDYGIAFEGTVSSVDGEVATFEVEHWYRGGDAATVEIRSTKDPEFVQTFAVGDRLLVAARDSTLDACTGILQADAQTRNLYRQAYEPR
ncbi:hypothetical protein ACIBQ5_36205 [Streptomyces massasporeus]|uniref:hypothetical protein n=1 Tax=Streptomyces massasporeus TaxID=67324 RepID=UPI0037910B40